MRLGVGAVAVAAVLGVLAAGGGAPARSVTSPVGHGSTGVSTAEWTRPGARPASAGQVLTVGRSAWVAVSVARLWQSPSAPWPVDAPALRTPVRFRTWLRAMTLDQRRALDVRTDTEALLG